jgi:flagellar biosynthetic protein FliR
MVGIETIYAGGIAVLVVAFRFAGLLLFSPVLAGAAIPESAKIFLVVVLAAAVFPGLEQSWHRPHTFSLLTLAQLFVTETLIGAAIGFVASIPILAVQLGGQIMGQQMGMGLAQIYNPELDANTGVVDQLLFYGALAVFISFGGLEAVFIAMTNTYQHIPLGSMTLTALPLELVVGTLAAGYELAVRVAAPVVAIMLIETVASAVLMKTIPQINILTIGFSIKTIAGLAGLAAATSSIMLVFSDEAARVLTMLTDWAGAGLVSGGGAH